MGALPEQTMTAPFSSFRCRGNWSPGRMYRWFACMGSAESRKNSGRRRFSSVVWKPVNSVGSVSFRFSYRMSALSLMNILSFVNYFIRCYGLMP